MRYDVHAMKTTGADAERLLQRIRHDTDLLQAAVSKSGQEAGSGAEKWSASERSRFSDALQGFQTACSGYERLLRYLDAAANVYSVAQEAASELADF